MAGNKELLTCVRRALRGVLCVNHAGNIPGSAERFQITEDGSHCGRHRSNSPRSNIRTDDAVISSSLEPHPCVGISWDRGSSTAATYGCLGENSRGLWWCMRKLPSGGKERVYRLVLLVIVSTVIQELGAYLPCTAFFLHTTDPLSGVHGRVVLCSSSSLFATVFLCSTTADSKMSAALSATTVSGLSAYYHTK